jgi:hypothetical protein
MVPKPDKHSLGERVYKPHIGNLAFFVFYRGLINADKASEEERMLLYWLNSEVVNSPHIANTLNKLSKLAKRDSLPVHDYLGPLL